MKGPIFVLQSMFWFQCWMFHVENLSHGLILHLGQLSLMMESLPLCIKEAWNSLEPLFGKIFQLEGLWCGLKHHVVYDQQWGSTLPKESQAKKKASLEGPLGFREEFRDPRESRIIYRGKEFLMRKTQLRSRVQQQGMKS